eukprot:TRINITY_DN2612_c0_g1_i2.p1 TRINITY_DN2612_c0_g1~~TRINITY_DN2612_c0_g1_i2.p1  ORF type:complete len:305 (+),score=36.60 TRINITY_DN2612_c0_g1_i2:130-1044(+)
MNKLGIIILLIYLSFNYVPGKYVALAIVSILLFGVYYLYKNQGQLLYHPSMPSREYACSPTHFQTEFEDVSFPTSDGETIHAWLCREPTKSPQAMTLLYFHGNAGNISHRMPHAVDFIRHLNCNVLLVSYRGYGQSTGAPTEPGLRMDAQAALDYVLSRSDLNTKAVMVFGSSLGGAVAIDLVSRNTDKVAGLIVENTFTSIVDMIDAVMPVMKPFKRLAVNKWESAKCIDKISAPILFLSGLADELVPPTQMRALFAKATSSVGKEMATFDTGTHNETFTQQYYYVRVADWVRKILLLRQATE